MEGTSTDSPRVVDDTLMHNARVLGMLFVYSMLMFSMPFAAFYGAKHVLLTHLQVAGFVNTVWSVVAAVATMYAIILTYAYTAYHDDARENTRQARNELNKDD